MEYKFSNSEPKPGKERKLFKFKEFIEPKNLGIDIPKIKNGLNKEGECYIEATWEEIQSPFKAA